MAVNYLQAKIRPVKIFDVQDKQHRKLFADYIRTGRWTHCPYQFIASEATQIDIGTIQRQMVEFYTEKEFGEKASKNG